MIKLSSTEALMTLNKNKGKLCLSAISAFEIATKIEKKKMGLPQDIQNWYPAALT